MHDLKNPLPEVPQVNRFLYDWLSLSFKGMTPSEMIDFLGLTDSRWEILTSGNGYTHRHFFNQISISFCEDMTHVNGFYLLEMSGQGCRTFETYGNGCYEKLFDLVRKEALKEDPADRNFRLTRLDVAFDDVSGLLDIDQICDYSRQGFYTCRMKTVQSIYGSKGNSATFGRKGSNVFIRIYDKARERGFNDGRHWIRCELQLRSDVARGFCLALSDKDSWCLYSGILRHYLAFREPSDDSNKARWEISPWWLNFLDHAAAISVLSRPGVEYNFSKAEKYFFTQPIGTIKSLLKVYGTDLFLEKIRQAPMPDNPKYERMINQVLLDMERGKVFYEQQDKEVSDEYVYIEPIEIKNEVRKKKFPFAKKIVTCIVCGHKGSIDDFWTYRGSLGECHNCRDQKVDLK